MNAEFLQYFFFLFMCVFVCVRVTPLDRYENEMIKRHKQSEASHVHGIEHPKCKILHFISGHKL